MSSRNKERQRTTVSMLVSLSLHALLLLILPGIGAMIDPVTQDEFLWVTVVDLDRPVPAGAPSPKPVAPVAQSKPTKVTGPTESSKTPEPVALRPAAQPQTKSLTAENPTEAIPTQPEPTPAERKPQLPVVLNAPIQNAPPRPPLVGDVVGGLGQARYYPGKEAALLAETVRLRVEVTVSPAGKVVRQRAISTTGNLDLDNWGVQTAAKQLTYKPSSEPYVVVIEVLVDPFTRRVMLASPDERVQYVEL